MNGFERKNIIVHAPVFSLSGYGRLSADFVMSLFNSGKYNMSVVPFLWGSSSLWQASKEIDDALIFMANNRISDGSEFTYIKVGVPSEFKRYSRTCNIGITAGLEVDQYPENWGPMCNVMDAVIVSTTFIRDRLLACGVTKPVYVVPWGVNTDIFNSNPIPDAEKPIDLLAKLDALPTSFNFVVSGQWLPGGVGEDRKNIPASAMCVINALADNNDVGVIVKTQIQNNSSPDGFALRERVKNLFNGPKVKGRLHILHGTLTDEELKAMYTHPKVKAFFSLTHGEGIYRPLAEAMACDLPAIVTGWSGHMDFVNPTLTTTIGYDMVQVPQSAWAPNLLGPGQTWAGPVYEEAENRVRRCYHGYTVAKERAVKQGLELREKMSMAVMDKVLLETMDQISSAADVNIGISSDRIVV